MSLVKRFVVNVSGCTGALLQSVEKAVSALPNARLVGSAVTSQCVQRWEETKGEWDVPPLSEEFECLVASPQAVIDVTYALYTKQIPVLLFEPANASDRFPLQHPLLEVHGDADPVAVLQEYLTLAKEPGRVFVIEGGDGAGKQTQVGMLMVRLTNEGYPVKTLDYPHDKARYGTLIRQLLSGRMGSIKDVNPTLFASLYGLNRHDTLPLLQYWLRRGYNVVLDRYMEANFGHQASKLSSEEERIAAIAQLRKFEVDWLGLPASRKVTYLDLPPDFALKAMQKDDTRKELDMHEKAGVEYKQRVRSSFLWCSQYFDHWTAVECVQGDARLPREAVHEAVYANVKNDLVNKGTNVRS